MMARSHVVFGISAWAGLSAISALVPSFAGFWGVILGALLPDIDHPSSTVGRPLFFISKPLARLTGHRTVTHSLLGFSVLLSCLYLTDSMTLFGKGLLCGVASHLVGDFLTKGGIPLFWPIKFRIAFPIAFVAGGVVESVVVYAFAALIAGMIFF